MYVQLFVFTFLTSVTFKTFRFVERALPQKESYSAFSTGRESESQKDLGYESMFRLTRRQRNERRFFFSQYLTIFPQHTSTETHSHTPAHAQFVVVQQLWRYISGFFWLCLQYRMAMHLHTNNVFFCLTRACHCSWMWEWHCSTWWGGWMGSLLLKPHIVGAVVVCESVLTFHSSSC